MLEDFRTNVLKAWNTPSFGIGPYKSKLPTKTDTLKTRKTNILALPTASSPSCI